MATDSDGRIYTRQAEKLHVPDEEWMPDGKWIRNAVMQTLTQLKGLRRVIEDRTRPVDEYIPGGATASEGTLEILPQFDSIAERIESILYWGPVASTGTIQLGDMTIGVVVPATGWAVISPISMLLTRADRRVITLNPAGNLGMRLMGWADERY